MSYYSGNCTLQFVKVCVHACVPRTCIRACMCVSCLFVCECVRAIVCMCVDIICVWVCKCVGMYVYVFFMHLQVLFLMYN